LNRRSALIIGGARSGKSQFAQDLALRTTKKVLFVATAEPLDEEMQQRIIEHKRSRPRHWRTLEAPVNVSGRIAEGICDAELVIIDCITLLVSNLLTRDEVPIGQTGFGAAEKAVEAEVSGIVDCMERSSASFVLVSNEVGLGLVPGSPLERSYRDSLGRANQALARYVDAVYLMVAGIPVDVKALKSDSLGD